MAVPKVVNELIERFERNYDTYKNPGYNETQVRREFLDPFFEALGWDVLNKQGHAEAYKDVIHEDAIKVGSATKAPDYSFRIGGTRKFFVEAKKPSVYLKENPEPAYQLRRYAWSAKLPLSILTDFEEFVIYDCRKKPSNGDKASVSRLIYYTYKDYHDKWDEIAGIFSREAVLKGSFDKYAETRKGKRGTSEVDGAFLAEIESWRELLAKNLAQRNPELSQKELNFAVQRIIDRIIFLRMCEDRGVEDYGTLQHLLDDSPIYDGLKKKFHDADDRYNSGIFHFTKERDRAEAPDTLTPKLKIDDKTLKQIIGHLYYPESPYEFSVLSPEILGQVYEQFLGKVIRLTANHQAKVEDKPEVRKAGGVYYTPTYIVDYIVKNTVGKLLEGKAPKDASKLRILDPACGSGSFLVGAYQYLLNWHRDWYLADGTDKHRNEIYQGKGGQWYLSTEVKRKILLNNIYGVDIDAQAVEVTKLSLLLKVLEDESQETLEKQRKLFHERALPDLGSNIKCGNSLIGPDFYKELQGMLFDEEERERINVFDWHDEYHKIMQSGGFDAVIGNPPYIRMEEFKELKSYLRNQYASHDERSDIYVYFLERATKLLRKDGCLGMIVSNKFIRANYGANLREVIAKLCSLDRIVDLAGLPVFPAATVRTIVLTARRSEDDHTLVYSPPPAKEDFLALQAGRKGLTEISDALSYKLPASALSGSLWTLTRPERLNVLSALRRNSTPLKKIVNGMVCRGVVSGLTEAFVIDDIQRKKIISRNPHAKSIIKPFLQGRDIRKYRIEPRKEYLIYTHHGIEMKRYPAVLEHLRPFKDRLDARATDQPWYELQQPQFAYVKFFDQPKIVFPDIATSCRFAFDAQGFFGANTVYFLPTDNFFVLGILNSSLAQFYFAETCAALEGAGDAYLRFFGQYMEDFPVINIPSNDKVYNNRMVKLVERMLDLHKKKPQAKTPQEITRLERDIAATDKEIDQLVYELYGLTKEEIKIVEESTS